MGELLYGSDAHRPLSSSEMNEWMALWHLRNWEQEQAMKKSRKRR